MKTLFLKSNILYIRTNEGEFEVSNPEVVASSMLFDLNHIPVDFEWPYGVELIDMLQIRVGNEWKNLLYQKEYKGNMESTRTIKLARLLPKEEFKPAQPTPNFPKGGTTFTESAYKEFETAGTAHKEEHHSFSSLKAHDAQAIKGTGTFFRHRRFESSEPQEKEHLLKDWKWPAIEIERELHKYLGKVTSVDGKSEFHLGFRLCRDWIQKHYFLIYKANKLPIDSDKSEVYAPSESQEEPVLFADWLIKNGWEPQMTEGCWIQYAEEPIMKKTTELYQQFTITRNP